MNVLPIQSLSSTGSRDSSTIDRSPKDDAATDPRQSFEAALEHVDRAPTRPTGLTNAGRGGALVAESEGAGDTEKASSKGTRQHRAKTGASCDSSQDTELEDDSDSPLAVTAQAIPTAIHFETLATTSSVEPRGVVAPIGEASIAIHDATAIGQGGDANPEASVPKALLDRLDAVSPHEALPHDIRALVEQVGRPKVDSGISTSLTTQHKEPTTNARQSVAASTPEAALDPSARGAALALGDLARRIGADISWQTSGSSASTQRAVGIRSPEAPQFEDLRVKDSSAANPPSPFDLAFSKHPVTTNNEIAAPVGDAARAHVAPADRASADQAALRIMSADKGAGSTALTVEKVGATTLHPSEKDPSAARAKEPGESGSASASSTQRPARPEVTKARSTEAPSVDDSPSTSAESANAGSAPAHTTQASSAANGRSEDAAHQSVGEATADKAATPDARAVPSKLDGSHAAKDASKDKDASKSDSVNEAPRVIDGAVRTVEGLRASTKVSDAHVARVIDERSAERQSNVEVAVSRMTLKNGMRAETEVADLGRVTIEAKNHANNLDLKVIADRPETARLIERNRSELRADVDRSHEKIADLSISSRSSGAGSSFGQGSDRRGQGTQRRDRDGDVVSDASVGDASESGARSGKRVRIVL